MCSCSGINIEDPTSRKDDDEEDLDGPNEMVRNLLKKAAQLVSDPIHEWPIVKLRQKLQGKRCTGRG